MYRSNKRKWKRDLGYSQFSLRMEKRTLKSTNLEYWSLISKARFSNLTTKFHTRKNFESQLIQSSLSIRKVSTDGGSGSQIAAKLESQPLSSKFKTSAVCVLAGSIVPGLMMSPLALKSSRFQRNMSDLSIHVDEI